MVAASPFVVYASAAVVEKARRRRVLPEGACLEREVERAIADGRVRDWSQGGGYAFSEDWVATCVRRPGRVRKSALAFSVMRIESGRWWG